MLRGFMKGLLLSSKALKEQSSMSCEQWLRVVRARPVQAIRLRGTIFQRVKISGSCKYRTVAKRAGQPQRYTGGNRTIVPCGRPR